MIPTSVPGFVVENSVPPPPLAPPIVSLGESLSAAVPEVYQINATYAPVTGLYRAQI